MWKKEGYVFSIMLMLVSFNVCASTFFVGPSRSYTVPSQVMPLVQDSDTVLIDAGDYYGDVGIWNPDNLVLMGVGGTAHLHADGNNAQGKAIWVIKGDSTYISHMEFSECQVPDHNGAGIRHEGKMLTLQHCSFHHNEMGILTLSQNPGDHILIEYSEFYENGYGDGFSHSIYVNHSSSLTVRYSYFHQARIGHHIKSRAARHVIEYNKIIDGTDGNSSRLIDLSNGGNALIRGNILVQGALAENGNLIGYGLEGITEPTDYFICINNTLVSYRHAATFFDIAGIIDTTLVANCIVAGPGNLVNGQLYFENMWCTADIDSVAFQYPNLEQFNLSSVSPAIDQGGLYGLFNGMELLPQREYVYEMQGENRTINNIIDLGAHEFLPTSSILNTRPNNQLVYPSITQDYIYFYKIPGDTWLVSMASGHLIKTFVENNSLDISGMLPGWYVVIADGQTQFILKN